ncbi:ABC transporter permease [Aerococcus kribbianus]|uniref:Putative hemin transport system permease protein HrtB n=1 Tax=Aerococcus kribbianus TaxID=2999064 RepID=A0A9X3JGR5_9LACT|nr:MULTISPECIES: ABC transporter permease [unclassified Aerococcus]MCZ0717546.1 ABC transporter permease [Aerococcus sp. YH-aer221]MCZ0725834.1 ABC transporter permease [Aerococcus sp. YH-aer222]
MFLALKEIQHSKWRYVLVAGLLFLVAYLVFFLTGLAYGLAQSNRSAIDKWQADEIILSEGVSNRVTMSHLSEEALDQVSAEEKAPIGIQMALFTPPADQEEAVSGQLFGIEKDNFLMPNIIEGRPFEDKNEVVVDQSLAEEYGFALGDTLAFEQSDDQLTIVGFTDQAQMSVQPVIYMALADYKNLEIMGGGQGNDKPLSAIVVRGSAQTDSNDLQVVAISDFINDLPGYSAQNMTFLLMIGFLIVISAIVIAIFIYVLTLQKTETFGVMKAQGIPARYIIGSVIGQTFLLSTCGVVLGLLVTYLSSLVLPAQMPYLNNWLFFSVIAVMMVVVAMLGGLFSAKTITDIDPLDAIS